MPIPTRSASLREPRKPPQSSSIARPAQNTTNPTSGTLKASARPTTDKTRPPSNPSPAEGQPVKDNGVTQRGRTLLPQRNGIPARNEGHGQGQVRFQPPESKLPQQGETSPTRPAQTASERDKPDSATATTTTTTSAPMPTRRQSLMRPGALRVTSTSKTNAGAPTKGNTPTFAPPSPRKQAPSRSPIQSSHVSRPPSPKKTDMLPPQRPVRSASLRQPPGAGSGPPAAARGHARHRSQLVPSSAKQIQPDPALLSQKSRPHFSTYQQHYSPKKSTKPPTPTPGATPGPSSLLIPTSWPDIAALQTELLQLCLFHSNSLQRRAEGELESEARLRKRYDAVADQYRSTLVDEKRRQRQVNAQALDCWLQNCRNHRGPHGFPEQIQILSQVLQEISDLVTSGMNGRYNRAVETFESWFEQAEDVRHHRKSSGSVDGTTFLDPLDRTWREELQALYTKLELCARQLQSLDILGFGGTERLEQSALTRVAQGLTESIQLMMQEIRAMRDLETELVRSEREAVSRLATESTGPPRKTKAPHVGVWRT